MGDGTVTLVDGTTLSPPTPSDLLIATYVEADYLITLVQASPTAACTSMDNYYNNVGDFAEILHIHWLSPVFPGCVTSVTVERTDGGSFLWKNFGLTTHTVNPGRQPSGTEDAYIADTHGVEYNIPPNTWGSPRVISDLPFVTPTTKYTIQLRTPSSIAGLGFAFMTFAP